jgi:calcineurin-like phosphoesterase
VITRFVTGMPGRLPVADGDEVTFNSVMIEIDEATNCATSIERIDRKVLVT